MIGAHGWGFLFFCLAAMLVLSVLIGVPYFIVKKVRANKAAQGDQSDLDSE